MPKRVKMGTPLVLGFSNEDKLGTIQPHDDALVVTLRIGGYDVKRVTLTRVAQLRLCIPTSSKG